MAEKHYKIAFEGETLIVAEAGLPGYAGCQVLEEMDGPPQDNVFALASPEHLSSVHLQKALEAVLVLSGYKLSCGLLAEEATATGVELQSLAMQVHEKRRAERDFEVGRRLAKTTVKA